jgi:MFS family permease
MRNLRNPQKNVLLSKNFALLFWGDFVSKMGNVFFSLAVSFYILEITDNNALIQGAYLAVAGIVYVVFTPLGGVVADRFNKAKIIYFMDFIRGAVILLCALFVTLLRDNVSAQLVMLFVMAVVLNICGAIFAPATSSIIRFLVDEDQLQQANGYFSGAQSVEAIVGVLAAGVFYAAFGIIWVFVFDGLSFIASGISELFIKYEAAVSEQKLTARAVWQDLRAGLKYVSKNKPIMAVMTLALGINMVVNPVFANGIPYLCNTLLAGPGALLPFMRKETWYAAFEIALSAGMLVSSIIVGSLPQKERAGGMVRFGFTVSAVLVAAMAGLYGVLALNGKAETFALSLTGVLLLTGAVLPLINIPIGVALMKQSDPAMLGKVSGIVNTMSQALIPLGSVIGGALIAGFGLGALFLFTAIGFTVMVAFSYISKPMKEL